jgi:hypothetical protein
LAARRIGNRVYFLGAAVMALLEIVDTAGLNPHNLTTEEPWQWIRV